MYRHAIRMFDIHIQQQAEISFVNLLDLCTTIAKTLNDIFGPVNLIFFIE